MIHISGFCAAMSARWNSSEKGLMRSRSRTCLALLPMVLLATPNASLSWSAVTYGWLAGSNRKFAWYPAEAKALAWMERTSLPLGHLQDPRVTRRALDSLTLRLNGTQATPHTIVRKRAVFHNALAAVAARSVALAGFGLDSLIEIGASTVVIWELPGTGVRRRRRALRLIGYAFAALAAYLLTRSTVILAAGYHPRHSALGITWTAVTAAAMFALAAGKARTGQALSKPVLSTEGKVTRITGSSPPPSCSAWR